MERDTITASTTTIRPSRRTAFWHYGNPHNDISRVPESAQYDSKRFGPADTNPISGWIGCDVTCPVSGQKVAELVYFLGSAQAYCVRIRENAVLNPIKYNLWDTSARALQQPLAAAATWCWIKSNQASIKGTERQIAYAEDLREAALVNLVRELASGDDRYADGLYDERWLVYAAAIESAINVITTEKSARWLLDHLTETDGITPERWIKDVLKRANLPTLQKYILSQLRLYASKISSSATESNFAVSGQAPSTEAPKEESQSEAISIGSTDGSVTLEYEGTTLEMPSATESTIDLASREDSYIEETVGPLDFDAVNQLHAWQMCEDAYRDLRRWHGIVGDGDLTGDQKIASLMDSIHEHGWQGAPLVVWSEHLLAVTGTHRLKAVEGDYFDLYAHPLLESIPVIEIEALCNIGGVDFEDMLDRHDFSEETRHEVRPDTWDYQNLIIDVIRKLPPELVEYYGLDLH